MRRPLSVQVLAMLVALLSSVAAPASALMHGMMHAHPAHAHSTHAHAAHTQPAHTEPAHTHVEAETAANAHEPHDHDRPAVEVALDREQVLVGISDYTRWRGSAAEATDVDDTHAHPAIGAGVRARDGETLRLPTTGAALASRSDGLDAQTVRASTASAPTRSMLARPDPGGTAPPQLRAPPVG
ncbi:MAG: hypothetical protein KA154_09770 [Gemmatimonadaceae bacterium]|nr:hypothetical protein [Gemmatimonadaceae bacterium]MCC6430192.1 hypothetical protein [Gemmatimonadaceae bacterium]